jgi:hypothetical protein
LSKVPAEYSNDSWMLKRILDPINNKELIDCIHINYGIDEGNWKITAEPSRLSLTVIGYGQKRSITFEQLRAINPERPLSYIWKLVRDIRRIKRMGVPRSMREKYDKIANFRKKWGIERNSFTINGMEFELEFDIMRENPEKVLCWISTEEHLPAEQVVLFLMSLGLLPKEADDVKVKWNA